MAEDFPPSVTGTIDFKVGDEVFQTWYRLFGKLKSGRRPFIFLHGGPGIPSFYNDVFSDLTKSHGIPVIIYDQVGCGNSTHLQEKDASFWTEKLFMDELENLLAHFDIADDFDLGGHSWGGMLSSRFAGSRQPKGLKHLVIGNSPATMKDWVHSNLTLLKQIPQQYQDIINKHEEEGLNHEADGTKEAREYQEALGFFLDKFMCWIKPHPASVAASEASLAEDNTVNKLMYVLHDTCMIRYRLG